MYERALEILNTLYLNGYEGYIIGGYPRDKYLNRYTDDIDICTSALPEDINRLFGNVDMTYKKYGNTIVDGIQITTYREDIKYVDNRYNLDIKYVKTLKEDLKRRDFIINTLCIDRNGNYIDYLNARKDLDDKIIRVVGNTYDKIEEDELRILRAIRFSVVLDFDLDKELEDAIKKYASNLSKLSHKKASEELSKMFNHDKEKSLYLLNKYGLYDYLKNIIEMEN